MMDPGFSPLSSVMHPAAHTDTTAPALRASALVFTVLGALLLVLLLLLDTLAPGDRGFLVVTRRNIDSICYFSTAHSLLFDRDFDITNQLAVMIPPEAPLPRGIRFWVDPVPATGLPGSPYAIGYSLLGIPFLAAGTALDALAGGRPDGYGPWAERIFCVANIFYLVLGLLVLHRWLVSAALQFEPNPVPSPRSVTAWALAASVALVPATALGYYTFTVMSHPVSFLSVALFLYLWWDRRQSVQPRHWVLIGAAAALMTLCRWQNSLYLAVIVVCELSTPGRLARFSSRTWWQSRAAGAAAMAVLLVPQFAQWHVVYGSWFTVPQGQGFFELPPSRILHVLFSSNNGLFFTTPATLAGFLGLFLGLKRHRPLFAALLAAAAIQIVLIGSLPKYWDGRAFAMRNLINLLPLVALGWLFLLLNYGRRARAGVLAWVCLGAAFTLLSAAQWRYELVPRHEPLTWDEAVTGKFQISSALRRAQAIGRAQTSADLELVRRQHGDSAILLLRLRDAYSAEGRPRDAAAIETLLQHRRARTLF